MSWSFTPLHLELLFTFKISRSASDYKNNFIVRFEHDGCTGLGECAPNLRYGETVEAVKSQLEYFVKESFSITHLTELYAYLKKHDVFQSVKNALETCLVDYLSKKNDVSIPTLLNLQAPVPKPTMFTIPIMASDQLEGFFKAHQLAHFTQIKLKISRESASDTIPVLIELLQGRELFIDANESFPDLESYLAFEAEFKDSPFKFVEQPFPAANVAAYKALKPLSRWPIFGDESVISRVDMNLIAAQFHGVNVKMMKAGGFLESINLLQQAKKYNLMTMLGCMVETSVGISHAFQVSALADYLDLDSFMYVKNEPYKLIKQHNGMLHSCQ
ncbi:MAG TPA: enolase C-terminal domain-like protein [Cytophagales bacterium]|nr:enolase C-terminal domain-like protein [Cytophagales bacterium]